MWTDRHRGRRCCRPSRVPPHRWARPTPASLRCSPWPHSLNPLLIALSPVPGQKQGSQKKSRITSAFFSAWRKKLAEKNNKEKQRANQKKQKTWTKMNAMCCNYSWKRGTADSRQAVRITVSQSHRLCKRYTIVRVTHTCHMLSLTEAI